MDQSRAKEQIVLINKIELPNIVHALSLIDQRNRVVESYEYNSHSLSKERPHYEMLVSQYNDQIKQVLGI